MGEVKKNEENIMISIDGLYLALAALYRKKTHELVGGEERSSRWLCWRHPAAALAPSGGDGGDTDRLCPVVPGGRAEGRVWAEAQGAQAGDDEKPFSHQDSLAVETGPRQFGTLQPGGFVS